jgi:hypothetical protein
MCVSSSLIQVIRKDLTHWYCLLFRDKPNQLDWYNYFGVEIKDKATDHSALNRYKLLHIKNYLNNLSIDLANLLKSI